MAEYEVRITRVGIDRALRLYKDAQERMKDLSPPLKKARNLMLASIEDNFLAQGRPRGWTPVKSAYLERKLRDRYNFFTLIRTGDLRKSVTASVRGNKLAIGTSIVYGATHQFGDPSRNIPKRPYLVFQKQDLDDIQRLVIAYITGRRF